MRYRYNAVLTTLSELGPNKVDVVPVLLKNGDFHRVAWGGFLDQTEVEGEGRYSGSARPIKLDILEYSVAPGHFPVWRKVPDKKAVQGALLNERAFCVVRDGMPKMVPRPAATAS
ncbi:hypothetical protein FHR99_003220 [Litorivivens lipolytica]|uniref:Uncharacterized protein n=1 Tax=Litorivivens lipolytica TaxID=1524264 RepID=A0A7W4Z8G8_9GAMM|nr:hypothetical protein [Litorivivens lipolytica]MBB3048946.1 hypothetical protein [Litorivivens lipolytica]